MTTQPTSGSRALLGSILATRSLTVIAAAAIAVVAADTAVALSRGGSSHPAPPAAGPTTSATVTPTGSAAPTSLPTTPSVAPTSTQNTLKQLLAATFAKALAQHTVHSVARDVSKTGTAVFVDDDAQTGGIQRISIHGGHIQIRVVGSTTYFTGDRAGLKGYFDFSDAEIQALNGAWISLRSGQTGYQEVTAGITLASTLDEDLIAGELTREAAKTINGQQVYGITGVATGTGAPKHATATLWISTSTGLPVEYDAANQTTQLTQAFSDWGKPIPLEAPTRVYGQKGLSG